MNKRRTKGWFGERGSIGRPLFGRLASLSRRSVPSALLLLAFALLPCARVEGMSLQHKYFQQKILLSILRWNARASEPLPNDTAFDESILVAGVDVSLWQRYAIEKRFKRKRGVP